MKNAHVHPLVANLPPCVACLLSRVRCLPVDCLPPHPDWWFGFQFTRLLNGGLPPGVTVQAVIGLPAALPADARRAYDTFFDFCRRLGLTEEQVLLLVLLRLSTESPVVPT